MSSQIFVITGGPGSGKSTLIAALAQEGIATMPEAGRAIIQDQVMIGGDALPWADRAAFAALMLTWELRSYREAQAMAGPVVCDRGVPDVIGYLTLCGLPIPEHLRNAASLCRYNTHVLLAPWWPDIFHSDTERKQDAEEAKATAAVMAEVYSELGYNVVELPRADIATRVQFTRQMMAR